MAGLFRYPGVNETVYDSIVFDDGSGPALYLAGSFRFAGLATAEAIVRWNGGTFTPLGAGLGPVLAGSTVALGAAAALAVFNDGTGPALYAAGSFTQAGGIPANRVARWNGSR